METHNLVTTLSLFTFLAMVSTGLNTNSFGETTKRPKMYYGIRKNEIIKSLKFKDMPQEEDMTLFMDSLNKIVDFCTKYKEEIDMNFAFGLFIINVNLKKVLRYKSKTKTIGLMNDIQELVDRNSMLLKYFNLMVKNDTKAENALNKRIYSLFTNDTQWMERLPDMSVKIESRLGLKNVLELDKIYWRKRDYLRTIFDSERLIPTPKQSDKCLGSMADHMLREVNRTYPPLCKFDDVCYSKLLNGSDIGYAITHRLLWLLFSHYGRGCVVFSLAGDRKITERLCTTIFSEAQFIALLKFPVIDLLLEQVAFCILAGHQEFLKRDWLLSALTYQRDMGCFAPKVKRKKFIHPTREWLMMTYGDHSVGGLCDAHLTATAAAAISSAVRYLTSLFKYK